MERRLVCDGREVRLSPKVFETLVLLVERHGLLVEKDDLMKALWPGMFVEEVTLAGNISRLRKALGDPPGQEESQYIETVSKRGYRFIADVREIPGGPQEARTESAAPNIPRRWWQNRPAWFVLAAVVLLAGIGGFWRYYALHHPPVEISSLAVLPLENLSGDPEQEYFVDGMTDDLITNLAQIHSLRVISRTSVMQFKHTKKTLPEIAAALHVDAIVEGTVSRHGNDVHVTAQLLQARPERHLWAASYERQMTDVLGLESQIAGAIADRVKANVTPAEVARLTKSRPLNPESYNAFLKGRFLRYRDIINTAQAVPYYQQAVAIDPNNAEAWAELADSYAHLGGDLGQVSPTEMRPLALEAVAKALEADPNLAEAYAASAWAKMFFDWDWAGAERDIKRAIELNPNSSTAHRYYSHYFMVHKRFDEALEENKRAIDLAPLDISPQFHLAWVYADARMGDKTIEQAKRILEMDPAHTNAYAMLGRGYELKGQWPEALAAYEKLNSRPAYLLAVVRKSAATGDRHQADPILAEFTEISKHRRVPPLLFAECYAVFNERDKAFEYLEAAYRGHSPGLVTLETTPAWDNLRSDARFQDLERRVGFR